MARRDIAFMGGDSTDFSKLDDEGKDALYHELLGELEKKDKQVVDLLYIVSHDLRSPMVAVQGFSEEIDYFREQMLAIVEEDSDFEAKKAKLLPILNDEMPDSVAFIDSCVQKIDSMLKGLLLLSRLGRMELNLHPVKMNDLLGGVVKLFKPIINRLDAEILIANVPDCLGDEERLIQLFTELVKNSLFFNREGRDIKISLSGQLEGKYIVYCIKDNGSGIHPDKTKSVFEVFIKNDKRANDKLGLGLAIARKIVERHNGKISVKSSMGEGASFYVSLPVN